MLKPEIVTVTETADLESEPELGRLGLQRRSDGLITWQFDSKDHPRNWTTARKTFDTTVIIFLEFFVQVFIPPVPTFASPS